MTIRETTVIQKSFYSFVAFKSQRHTILLCLLLVFSSTLLAQKDALIASDNFEETQSSAQGLVDKTLESKTSQAVTKGNDAKEAVETKSEVMPSIKEQTTSAESAKKLEQTLNQTEVNVEEAKPAVVVEKIKLETLEQKISNQQSLIEHLSTRVDDLTAQNQQLSAKFTELQTRSTKQNQQPLQAQTNKRPKIKEQLIQLAIQASQLKPEAVPVKETKQEPKKEGAWYEKLIVVKKIEKKQANKQSVTPLYAVLKQFDLVQLALETGNQHQWQSTIEKLTTRLLNQYPTHAQNIVKQLNALKTQNIAPSTPKSTQKTEVDGKFGIK